MRATHRTISNSTSVCASAQAKHCGVCFPRTTQRANSIDSGLLTVALPLPSALSELMTITTSAPSRLASPVIPTRERTVTTFQSEPQLDEHGDLNWILRTAQSPPAISISQRRPEFSGLRDSLRTGSVCESPHGPVFCTHLTAALHSSGCRKAVPTGLRFGLLIRQARRNSRRADASIARSRTTNPHSRRAAP